MLGSIEEDNPHVVPAHIKRQRGQAVGTFQQLAIADGGYAAYRGHTIADARDPADFPIANSPVNVGQRLVHEVAHLLDAVGHAILSSSLFGSDTSNCAAREASQMWPPSRRRTPPSKAGTLAVVKVSGCPTSLPAVSSICRTVASSSSPAISNIAPSSGCH